MKAQARREAIPRWSVGGADCGGFGVVGGRSLGLMLGTIGHWIMVELGMICGNFRPNPLFVDNMRKSSVYHANSG
jgi:hypothetical protein